jgi:serine/threonine protein kinase
MADVLTKAGRYEVVRELGRGSMGIVYQGFDPVIGRTVAIKTMLTEGLAPEEYKEFRARFQREAQAAGVLSHPNIVNVFDYGEDNGILYLIMEFLEGTSLEKLVEGTKVLPIETIIPMCEQVCSALDHAHERGIVHRDIKPANIMILNNGMVKVTDFGIAKMISMGMTQAGLVLGTPNYMSPEQVKGRQVDGRSDLFSLGVILYDLVTGEKPFPGQNITTVIYKIINENPVPPRELDATIHPGLSYVICKALAKSPEERYQTCRELAEDLKNFRQLGGQAAAPSSATMILNAPPVPSAVVEQRPAEPTVRRPAPPVVPIGRTQVELPQPAPPAPAPTQVVAPAPSYQKPHSSPLVWVLLTLLGVAILGIVGGYYYLRTAKNNQPAANVPSGQTTSAATNLPSPTSGAPSTLPAEKPAASRGKTKANEAAPVNLPPASGGTKAGANPVNAASGGESTESSRPSTKVETPPVTTAAKESPAASLPAAGGTAASATPSGGGGSAAVRAAPAGGGGPAAAPRPGQLMVNSNVPGAKFTIDGSSDPGWVTPSTVSQPPGSHRVVISKDGYGEYEQTVDLEAGRTATINAQLSQAVGEIVVNTAPSGLEVFLDGKSLGPSPAHAVVPVGPHKYTVKRAGWEPYEGTVNVHNGAALSVRVNMGQ